MSCSCKHLQKEIEEGRQMLAFFRELFVARMTTDSEHSDRRRKDYNQAIFFHDDWSGEFKQCFNGTTMEMVLQCFDNAVKDWRESFCDTEGCRRKR